MEDIFCCWVSVTEASKQCRFTSTFLFQSHKCKCWHHLTCFFPDSFLVTFWISHAKNFSFVLTFITCFSLLSGSLLLELLLHSGACFILAFFLLGFPHSTETVIFVKHDSITARKCWCLILSSEWKWGKSDSLGHNHKIRTASLIVCI